MYDVIAIGDIALDCFLTLSKDEAELQCDVKKHETEICFNFGSKIPVQRLDFSLGGNSANAAVGLKRLGFKVGYYAIHGDDIVGRIADEKLEEEGLSKEFVHIEPGLTSYSTIINYQKERTILAKKEVRTYKVFDNFPKAQYMYVSSLGPRYADFYKEISKFIIDHKILLGYNPAPIELSEGFNTYEGLLRAAHFIFVNKEEAVKVLGDLGKLGDLEKTREALKKISVMGPKYVVITDGRNGADCFDGSNYYHCDIFPVEAVEATGAGDAFASGFMGAIMHGQSTVSAMKWGMVNSASVVTKVGAVAGLLSKGEIEKRLAGNPDFGPAEI